MMYKIQQTCQQMTREPYPVKHALRLNGKRYGEPIIGTNEDIGIEVPSLCPHYYNRQLRRIRRMQILKTEYGHGNVKDISQHKTPVSLKQIVKHSALKKGGKF